MRVRWAAIGRLANFKDAETVNALYEILATDKKGIDLGPSLGWEGVLNDAAVSLEKIGTPDAINAFYRALANDDERVRVAAGRALTDIGEDGIKSLVEIFTPENYKDDIGKIDNAIKFIAGGGI